MIFRIIPKNNYKITLIGAGGTGGYLLQSLARIAYEKQNMEITVIDGDIIEEKNIGRQNFYHYEIGAYKAQVLAERYSLALGLNIKPINKFLEEKDYSTLYTSDFIISCVDSAKSRKIIHNILKNIKKDQKKRFITYENPAMHIWMDIGNSKNSGQILIGNSFERKIIKKQKGKEISLIPYPSLLEPDLISIKKEKEQKENLLSCAERITLNEQSITINQTMATIASSMLNNLLEKNEIKSNKIIINEEIPMVISKLEI